MSATNLAWLYLLATQPNMAQFIIEEEIFWQLESLSGAAMVAAMRKSDRWAMWSRSQSNRIRLQRGESIVQAVTRDIADRDNVSIY